MCSTGLRPGDCEGHSIWFMPFTYSSNHSVTPLCTIDGGTVMMEETTPVRKEMLCHKIKVITQNSFVLICNYLSLQNAQQSHQNPLSVGSSIYRFSSNMSRVCTLVMHCEILGKTSSKPLATQWLATCFISYKVKTYTYCNRSEVQVYQILYTTELHSTQTEPYNLVLRCTCNDRGSKADWLKELFFHKTMTSPHMVELVKSLNRVFCIMKVPSARAWKTLYFSQESLNLRFFSGQRALFCA